MRRPICEGGRVRGNKAADQAVIPIAWSGAQTNINSVSTPVSTVSSQSLRSLRKWRKSLMGSKAIVVAPILRMVTVVPDPEGYRTAHGPRNRPSGREGGMIQINAAARMPQKWRMAFDLRRVFNIEVVGIATIVLSVAALVIILLSVW